LAPNAAKIHDELGTDRLLFAVTGPGGFGQVCIQASGSVRVFATNLIRPGRQPCLGHVAFDDVLLESSAPRTFKGPNVIARFAGLDVREIIGEPHPVQSGRSC
jgi:hypothetical protein